MENKKLLITITLSVAFVLLVIAAFSFIGGNQVFADLVGGFQEPISENVKSYDAETKTVSVKDKSNKKIATIKLNTPLIYNVIRGEDRLVAEMTIINEDKYVNALKKTIFYNTKENMKEIDREFVYKYKNSLGFVDVPITKKVCSPFYDELLDITYDDCEFVPTGKFNQVEQFEWVILNEKLELPQGEITIGIFTDVLPNEKIEWIPTFFGVEIREWAEWTESLNVDLASYYNLNETANNNPIDGHGSNDMIGTGVTQDIAGVVGTAYSYDGTNDETLDSSSSGLPYQDGANTDWSVNFWADHTSGRHILGWDTSDASSYFQFWVGASGHWSLRPKIDGTDRYWSSGIAPTSGYEMVTFTFNDVSNNVSVWVDGAYKTSTTIDLTGTAGNYLKTGQDTVGSFDWTGKLDEIGIWNRKLSDAEITQLYNGGAGITYIADLSVECTFAGYVKDSGGTGLVGAEVIIINQDDTSEVYENQTIAGGHWSYNVTNSTNTYMIAAHYNNTLVGKLKQGVSGTC